MKILVTGGAGYIGTELIKQLLTDESIEEIRIYDNLHRDNYNLFIGHTLPQAEKITFILGELLDSRTLRKALEGIDVVYHLAAKVTTPFVNVDAHFFEQVNHWGTAELVYALEDSRVSRVIFTSSTSVYGASKEAVNVDDQINPRTYYGISKMRAEQQLRRLSNKLDTIIIRLGNVYGYSSSMRIDAVINKFMFEANFQRRISINGTGKQRRSFIHVKYASEVLAKLLKAEVASGTYNLIDKTMSVLDIVDILKTIYPDLEFIFVNQHISMRELLIEMDKLLSYSIDFPETTSFEEELVEFKSKFSF